MTLPKFEWIEQYQQSGAESLKRMQTVRRERDSALETVQALKAEYEACLRRSLLEGADVSAALTELDAKITEAERAFKHRDEALRLAESGTVFKPAVNKEGLLPAWADYRAQYIADIVDPCKQAMLQAKLAYITAVQTYKAAIKHYDAEREYALNTVYPGVYPQPDRYKLGEVDFQWTVEREKYEITRGDLYDISVGRPVTSIQHIKEVAK